MSGHELKDEQIGVVRRLTEAQRSQAALRVARHAVTAGQSREAIVDVLEYLGLVDPAAVSPASVDANGMTVYPPSQETRAKAAARKREYKRNAREAS